MVSPEMDVLSVFITPWMKPSSIHCATRRACRAITPSKQRAVRLLRLRGLGVVPGDRVVSQHARGFDVALGGEVLEGADAEVARCDAGEDGSRQEALAEHSLAGGDRGQGAGGRHAQRRHGLAHDVFAQDRTERGAAVAAAGEGGGAGAFELDVVAHAVAPDHLAQQVGAAVAELRHEMPELVPGIGERQRLGPLGHAVAGQDLHALRAGQRSGSSPRLRASSTFTLIRRGAATGVGFTRA